MDQNNYYLTLKRHPSRARYAIEEERMNISCATVISAIRNDFSIESAATAVDLAETLRLRYEVFCRERNILPAIAGQQSESDEFDCRSRHILIRRRRNGELLGTVRLVTALSETDGNFPMQRLAGANVTRNLPLLSTAEISRFALSRQRREMGASTDSFIRLGLLLGVMRMSCELGLTHWCAAMEPSLLRLLRGMSIHFRPVGPQIEYHGLRQPSIGVISEILARGKQEKPELWDFVTDSGKLAGALSDQRLVA